MGPTHEIGCRSMFLQLLLVQQSTCMANARMGVSSVCIACMILTMTRSSNDISLMWSVLEVGWYETDRERFQGQSSGDG